MPIEFKDGLWWPAGDRHCRPVIGNVSDLLVALKYVKKLGTCVQSGGNCGIWASFLAGHFNEVWTIEADFTNYRCLVKNTAGLPSVRPIWAALSHASGMGVDLARDPANVGAHYIDNNSSRVTVTTLAIDDLDLGACDFIQLDIEGHEPIALEGARKTIERFKPVLMVEDKGLSMQYGVPAKWSARFPGYRVQATIHRDVILLPC